MRPYLARKRITFEGGKERPAGGRYGHIEPGPLVAPRELASGGCLLVLLAGGAALHVLLVAFLPWSATAGWYVYLPVALLTLFALGLRRLGVPPAVMAVVLCGLLLLEMTARGRQLADSDVDAKLDTAFWLIVGISYGWTMCMFLLLLARLWSLLTWSGLILGVLAGVACKGALPLEPQPLPLVQLLYGVGLTATALICARIYAGRCAASPAVPVRAVIRLGDLWQWGWEQTHDRPVRRFGWWSACLMSAASAPVYSALVWLWADVIICDPLPYGLPDSAVIIACEFGVTPLVGGLCLWMSPWNYVRHACTGTIVSLVHWHTDEHPAPHAPGVVSVSQHAPIHVRQWLSLAGLVCCAWSLIAQSPALGVGALQNLAWRAPLSALGGILSFAVQGLASVVLGVLVIGGPWFAYVGSIIAAAEAEELRDAASAAE